MTDHDATPDPEVLVSNRRLHALNLAINSNRDRFRFEKKSSGASDFAAGLVNDAAMYEAYLRNGTVPPMPDVTLDDPR